MSRKTLLLPLTAVLTTIFVLTPATPLQASRKSDKEPKIRIVCVDALKGHEEYIIASRKKNGSWKKHETVELRSSLITPWLEAPQGELFLCVVEDREPVVKCSFTFPKGSKRALVILLPGDKENKENEEDKEDEGNEGDKYKAQVIDTTQQAFGKGELLLVNSSSFLGEVTLGENKVEIEPGKSSVQKPSLDDKGMYHMLVAYTDDSGKTVTCSDQYNPGNDSGRGFLFLLPDPRLGLRVKSLTDFGPFE